MSARKQGVARGARSIASVAAATSASVVVAAAALASGGSDSSRNLGRNQLSRTDSSLDEVYAAAVQRDGKIVAAGDAGSSFALARYTRAGRLDRTFGAAGRVRTGAGLEEAHAVAIQGDGKIVAAGEGEADGFTVVRYTSHGHIDPTFGRGGKAEFDFAPACGGWARAVALQADGKIVVAGLCSGDAEAFVVARYTTDGRLDEAFGSGGVVLSDFGPGWGEAARALAIQSDGKIVAAGESDPESRPGEVDFALARYNADGSLDPSFGTGGKVQGGPGGAKAVAIQANGMIVAAGDGGVARYNRNGSVDRSFGTDGAVTSVRGAGVAIQRDGKIVTCWTARPKDVRKGPLSAYDFAVSRLTANGALDGSFGRGGKVRSDLGPRRGDYAAAVAVQDDGKIVVAGSSTPRDGRLSDFALARYTANGRLDRRFGRGGKVLTDFGSHVTSLSATRTNAGVLVRWRTDFELTAPGFDVYRDTNGRRVRLNRKPIPGKGNGSRGAFYSFLDRRAPKTVRRYWLWLDELDGSDGFYGPAVVKR